MTSKKANKQLGKQEWIIAALDQLNESGVNSVKVERLAVELGVTKGSFYHHFIDRQSLLDSVCDFWLSQQISHVDGFYQWDNPSAADDLKMLVEFISHKDPRHDLAMRLWAHSHELAAKAVQKVDLYRFKFCENLFKRMGCDTETAQFKASMILFYQIGDYVSSQKFSKKQRANMFLSLQDFLLTPNKTSKIS